MTAAGPLRDVREHYGRIAHRYDQRWGTYIRESTRRTAAEVVAAPGARILDVGCGTGQLLRLLHERGAGYQLWGLDFSAAMLAAAPRATVPNARWVVADAEAMCFPQGCFDVVASSSALHHWPHPNVVLDEIARVSRLGTRLVVTDWCRDVLPFRPFAAYLRRFDRSVAQIWSVAELERMMVRAGFRLLRSAKYRVAGYWGLMTVVGEFER